MGKDDGGLALFDLEKRALKRLVGRRASHADAGAAPSVRDPARENTKGVRALVVLESENAVVSAGADGRILAWRLTEARDDVEDTPFEEIQLSHPMGASHAPPRIRSLAVVASRSGRRRYAILSPSRCRSLRFRQRLHQITNPLQSPTQVHGCGSTCVELIKGLA